MSIDRIHASSDKSPQWSQTTKNVSENKEAARTPSKPTVNPHPSAAAARNPSKAEQVKSVNANPVALESAADKIRQLQEQVHGQAQIRSVDSSIAVTQQELNQASREQLSDLAEIGATASYWDRLSVVEKARAINRLKDKVRDLELDRGALVDRMSRLVQSGNYRVTGEEIAAGMAEEMS